MTYNLSWNIHHLTHRSNKPILHNINGSLTNGDFLTIMGPSGAGKSSLLSIITCRITNKTKQYTLDAQLTLNHQPYKLDIFSQFAAYVRQDDILLSTLSVEETLLFQATLKMSHLDQPSVIELVNRVIMMLNLEECRNCKVGGQQIKQISGGQKKRLAIGVELISNPKCLILDEPTSGLDSFNALKLIKILKNMCTKDGKIVIATLHQPSSLIFSELDLLLLMKNGESVYDGKADQIVNYMEDIGVKVDHRMNPADFFMLEISAYKEMVKYVTPMTAVAWNQYSSKEIKVEKERRMITGEPQMALKLRQRSSQSESTTPSILHQFITLTIRSWKNYTRLPNNLYAKPGDLIGSILVVGLCFINIGNESPQLSSIFFQQQLRTYLISFQGLVFISIFCCFGANSYETVLCFPPEKQLCLKETGSNVYNMNVYYFARMIVQLPWLIIHGVIILTIIYLMVGLERTWSHYFIFVSAVMCSGLVGFAMGSFIGIFFKNSDRAVQMMPIFTQPLILVGGQVCNLMDIPKWFQWFQYVSPMRHSSRIILLDQLQTSTFSKYPSVIQQLIKIELGVSGNQSYQPYLWLLFLFVFYSIASLLVLHIRKQAI